MTFKYCPRCIQILPVDKFGKSVKRADGLQSYCSECMKKYRLDHYYRNKQQYYERNKITSEKLRRYVQKLKKAPCTDCGIAYPDEPWLMEFDHLGKEVKLNSVAALLRYGSFEKIKTEIAKCELVCVLCHRRRTAKRAGWNLSNDVL